MSSPLIAYTPLLSNAHELKLNCYLVFQCRQVVLVSQVMVTDTVQWFWDPAIEWSECLHGGENKTKGYISL